MIIKVLGIGCTKCRTLEQRLQNIKTRHQLSFEIQKINQLTDIISYGVMTTPGLVINEQLKCAGKLPTDEEILKWIEEE